MRLLAALLFALFLGNSAFAQDAQAAIREMIQGQLDAFLAGDVPRAFGYAAPGIQGVFGTPERFGTMVREGYPMVWRPAGVRFLDLHPRDGGVWQRVMITDSTGRAHLLDYEIIPTEEGPRIGAVLILRMSGAGA